MPLTGEERNPSRGGDSGATLPAGGGQGPGAGGIPPVEGSDDKLRAGWNYYTNILEGMNDGVFIIDSEFDIHYLNKAAERVFGLPEGKKCYEYFHKRDTPCFRCRIGAVFSGESVRRIRSSPHLEKSYEVFEARLTNVDGSYAKLGIVHDITDFMRVEEALRLDEARFEALFRLSHMAEAPMDNIAGFVMEQGVGITRSKFGFLGFVSDDETVFTRHAASGATMKACRVAGAKRREVAGAGVWADAIRERRPVIVNDYKSTPKQMSLPRGHVPLKRLLSVPVLDGGKVVALGAVANKETDYDEADVRHLALLIDTMWRLVQRKEAERSLRASESQLRLLSAKLLSVQEEERERLAHELHDSLGQTLVAVKFGIESALRAKASGGIDAVFQVLEPLVPMVQNAVEEARKLYMGLRPTILDDFGAIAAIGWLCSEFEKEHDDIRVERTMDVAEEDIPIPVKIVLYRTVQEALSNTAKHSGASRVEVFLRKEGSDIKLTLQDNGHGFDSSDILTGKQKKGLGIATMKERVDLSGGSFSIESKSGMGTTIRASWPEQFKLKLWADFHL
jgi:PAS domain S-box-containing protein